MSESALDRFVAQTRASWGPLSTELVAESTAGMTALARANGAEPWLAALQREAPASRELYRDAAHGFVLLAHTEQAGLYRPPHDHGRAWVVYALARGEMVISTYGRALDAEGRVRLVKRDETLLCAGEARPYLPGDIHDTRCLSDSALLLRFTERDLKREDQVERRVTRYVWQGGVWTVGPR